MAAVTRTDVLYDLGSGDGRIPITAARRFGIRTVGIDIDPARVREAQENARKAGVADRVRFVQADIFEADFSEASVVTLYLLSAVNLRLRPRLLRDLKPGTRIVSHNYDMGDWEPRHRTRLMVAGTEHLVFLWVVPPPAAGRPSTPRR
jgi:ribosomal protein L11 methylase PrmA